MTEKRFPYFDEETEMIRDTVRRFVDTEMAPHAETWDEEGIFPREIFKKAGDLGIFGIRIDPEYGGAGMDWWATVAYLESLTWSSSAGANMGLMVQSDMTLPVIQELGNDEIKRNFLVPGVKGEMIAALGISEPGGGSDVAAIQCRARKDGDDYVISGQKLWITNGTRADFVVLAVRTGDDTHRGISFVVFPTDTKGYSVGRKLKKVGNLCSDTAELFFDECRIPQRYLLGEENKGFYYVMTNFQGERLAAAVMLAEAMKKSLKEAVRYGRERKVFGQSISDMQVWRHKIAEHLAAVEAAKWLCYRAVDLMNRGEDCVTEVTMAKLVTSDLVQKVTYDCQQIHGGFGYTLEYPIGRFWQDARLMTIGAGASEVMKEIIAKRVMPAL